jgi:hypothetical protein
MTQPEGDFCHKMADAPDFPRKEKMCSAAIFLSV